MLGARRREVGKKEALLHGHAACTISRAQHFANLTASARGEKRLFLFEREARDWLLAIHIHYCTFDCLQVTVADAYIP